jgi:hypothetical protein
LAQAPFGLAVSGNGFIFTTQLIKNDSPPAYTLMAFPPYAGESETAPDWAISMYPLLLETYGVAVDPTGSFVAVAVVGTHDVEADPSGGLYLFNATNGDFIADIDQTGGDAYYDVAWDNAGNLYALDGRPNGLTGVWRVYSPPGTNQATTVAAPVLQAYSTLEPPNLESPQVASGMLQFALEGQSNVTYIIQGSCDLSNWVATATNYSTCVRRHICVPAGGNQNFYRAVASP